MENDGSDDDSTACVEQIIMVWFGRVENVPKRKKKSRYLSKVRSL